MEVLDGNSYCVCTHGHFVEILVQLSHANHTEAVGTVCPGCTAPSHALACLRLALVWHSCAERHLLKLPHCTCCHSGLQSQRSCRKGCAETSGVYAGTQPHVCVILCASHVSSMPSCWMDAAYTCMRVSCLCACVLHACMHASIHHPACC